MSERRFVHVAAGILIRPDRAFLLASRPEGKPMAGYWEFPGGKIEAGESALQALERELNEELGITVVKAYPWLTQTFEYTHARVQLHFFHVVEWQGEPVAHEGQQLTWQHVGEIDVSPVLPANAPILKWLRLPERIGLSPAGVHWAGGGASWAGDGAVTDTSVDWRAAKVATPEDMAKLPSEVDVVILPAAFLEAPGWRDVLANGPIRPAYVESSSGVSLEAVRLAGIAGFADPA